MVAELHVVALRAILLYDTDEYVRLLRQIDQEGSAEQYGLLFKVAFEQAIRRRFGSDTTRGDVIRFVAEARAGRPSRAEDFDILAAERLVRGYLGDQEALRSITGEDSAAMGPLLLELVAKLPPDETAVEEFLTQVRARAVQIEKQLAG